MKGSILENGYQHEEVLARKIICAPQRSPIEPCAGLFTVYKDETLTEIFNAKVGENAVFSLFSEKSQAIPGLLR